MDKKHKENIDEIKETKKDIQLEGNKEDIESIRQKIEEENKEYEVARLKKISDLDKKNIGLSRFYVSTAILFALFSFMFFFLFNLKENPINVALKFKDMTISTENYSILKNDLDSMDKKLNDEQLKVYATDLLILSRYAKEEGITVNDKDIKYIKDLGHNVLCEELALVKKLKESFEDKAKNFKEEDYLKHYEETKDPYYRENGNISYYYFHSQRELFEDTKLDESKLELRHGTLEELNLGGITDFTEGIVQNLWFNEENNTYQYIYIVDANMTYYPYESVKEEVKKHLDHITTEGKLSEIVFLEKEKYTIETFEKK